MTMDDKRTPQPRSTAFGQRLKQYRERSAAAGLTAGQCRCTVQQRDGLTIEEVIAQMNTLEYDLTERAYTDIEEGVLPVELERFFEAIVIALDLCEHERLELLRALAYSVLEIELGEGVAASLITGRSG